MMGDIGDEVKVFAVKEIPGNWVERRPIYYMVHTARGEPLAYMPKRVNAHLFSLVFELIHACNVAQEAMTCDVRRPEFDAQWKNALKTLNRTLAYVEGAEENQEDSDR